VEASSSPISRRPPPDTAHPDLVTRTEDIAMLGGPGDEKTVTVEIDEEGMLPQNLVAFVMEDDTPPVDGLSHLEPVAGGAGPPWLYVFVDR
jgi:hypothetical protein